MEVNRDLSNLIWNNPHIDDMQKARIMPLVRWKEEAIAQLEAELAGMKLMEAEAESFAEGIVAENEQLLKVVRRAELDVRVNLNPMLERMNMHPFTLLEKDLHKALGGDSG